jgi:hypothetical protein
VVSPKNSPLVTVFFATFLYSRMYFAVLLERGWMVTFWIFWRAVGSVTSAMKAPKSFLSSAFRCS